MTIAQRGSATTDFGFGTSVTCNKPTGVAIGDLLLWQIENGPNGQDATITTPAGFTLIGSTVKGSNGTPGNGTTTRVVVQGIYARVADGSEGSSFTATGGVSGSSGGSPGSQMAAILTAWSGVDVSGGAAAAIDAISGNSNGTAVGGTTITATTITISAANELLLGMHAEWETDRGPLTGMTVLVGSGNQGISIDSLANPSTGATGSLTCACSTTEVWTVFLLALKAASAGGATGDQESPSPLPTKRQSPRVEGWEPLPALPAASLTKWGFSPSPVARAVRALRSEGWEPLGSVAVPEVSSGWGFSAGQSLQFGNPVVPSWEPLPGLPAAALTRVSFECSPLPPKLRAPSVATWEPLGPLLSDPGFSDQPQPTRLQRARNEGWEPLAFLPISSALPLVDASSPQPCRRAAPRPDGWEPLAGIAAAPAVTSGGWECQAAPQRLVRAQQPQVWEPLAPLLVPSVECSAVAPSRLRAPAVQGWEPLPTLIATPLTPAGGFESAAPPVPARRSPVVQAWEPLGAVQAPPSVAPLGFSDSPVNRATRARVEAWEPVPALPPVAAVACFSESPIARRAGARIDGWSPVPSLTADALGPLVCSVVPPQPRRQQQAPGGWEPLASLTDAVGDCFSPPPTKSRQRGAMVACWEPLAGITALPAPEAWGFSAQPVGRVRAARVDSWGVLASLSVGPVAPMRQQYLLQAV